MGLLHIISCFSPFPHLPIQDVDLDYRRSYPQLRRTSGRIHKPVKRDRGLVCLVQDWADYRYWLVYFVV